MRAYRLECGHDTEVPGPQGATTGRAWCPECGCSQAVVEELSTIHAGTITDLQMLAYRSGATELLNEWLAALQDAPNFDTSERTVLVTVRGEGMFEAGLGGITRSGRLTYEIEVRNAWELLERMMGPETRTMLARHLTTPRHLTTVSSIALNTPD